MTKDAYVSVILNRIDSFGRDIMSAYLIFSVERQISEAQALEVVELAITYQCHGVAALDLCGDPSRGDVSIY